MCSMACTDGDCSLRTAIGNGDTDSITKIVGGGVDINKIYVDGLTPLMLALQLNKNIDVIRTLVQLGSAVNVRNSLGNSPLMYALRSGSSIEVVKFLIDKRADVNAKNIFGVGCLLSTKFSECDEKNCRNKDTLELLLDKGADIHRGSTDHYGNTMLHIWCPCALNILPDDGMPLEVVNKEGRTPLMTSVIENNLGKFEYLLLKGANPNCKDLNFDTPLHVAQDCTVVCKLIYSGANLNALNNRNERPLVSLIKRNHYLMKVPIGSVPYLPMKHDFHSPVHAFIRLALLIDEQSLYFNDICEFLVKYHIFHQLFVLVTEYRREVKQMKSNYFVDGVSFYDLCSVNENTLREKLNHYNSELILRNCWRAKIFFPNYSDIINMKLKYYGFDIVIDLENDGYRLFSNNLRFKFPTVPV